MTSLLWESNVLLNWKLGRLDDKVQVALNANCKIIWEQVACEFATEGVGNMVGDYLVNGSWDAKGLERWEVILVLVETE